VTTNNHRGAAEKVLITLDADSLDEIETLPIGEVKSRLVLGLSPSMPADLKSAIEASTSAALLEEDAEDVFSMEYLPLTEVTGRLQAYPRIGRELSSRN
jgi:hypothetical protein